MILKKHLNFIATKRIESFALFGRFNFFLKNERGLGSLINTVRIFSADIEMEFGMEKCAGVVMKEERG